MLLRRLMVMLTIVGCTPASAERKPEREQATTARAPEAVGQTGDDVDAVEPPTDQVKTELVSMTS